MLTTLPPEYNSDDKRTHGHFELTLSAPVWTSDVTDVKQAHIRFWGHSSSNERVLEVPEEHGKTFLSVPITVGPAKLMTYMKEVYAVYVIFRHGTRDIASCTFPLVQIGPSELNSSHEGNVPLLCSVSSQCIGHVRITVKVSFPDFDAFQELECHAANASSDFYPNIAGKGDSQPSKGLHDSVDGDADALLKPLFERLRTMKGKPKEENFEAQNADIFSLVHAVCKRRPGRLKTAFNECDQNKSGSIDAEDLARVVEKILPFVPSDEQLSVFRPLVCRLMMDTSGTSEFTLQDVQSVVGECRDIVSSLKCATPQKSLEVLHSCALTLQQRSMELGKRFRALDVERKGELPLSAVLDLIQDLTGLPEQVRRCFVAKQHAVCRSRLEWLSLADMRHFCRQIVDENSSSRVHKRKVETPARRERATDASEGESFCLHVEPQCGGASPQSHGLVRCGSPQALSQSLDDASEFTHGYPDILSTHPARRSCVPRESLEQFEAQYSEIQQMLARNPRRNAARRRSDSGVRAQAAEVIRQNTLPPVLPGSEDPVGDSGYAVAVASTLQEVQHCQAPHDVDEFRMQGVIDAEEAADCLLAQALKLRSLIAELSSSVCTPENTGPDSGCVAEDAGDEAGNVTSNFRQTETVQHGQTQTGHNRALAAVELATMKALATASAASPSCAPKERLAELASGSPGTGTKAQASNADENDSTAANLAEQCTGVCASPDPETSKHGTDGSKQACYSPVSDGGDVDAWGELQVSRVQDIVLPPAARSMFDAGVPLGVWLAWRLPGSVAARPCLHLIDIHAADVNPHQNGPFTFPGKNVNVLEKVPLALSRLRSAATLGQQLCLQCELWLLRGQDSMHALSQASLSLLIGLCSIPLQHHVSERSVVELTRGCHTLQNVLEGWDGAKLEVQLSSGLEIADDLKAILPRMPSPQVELPESAALVAAPCATCAHSPNEDAAVVQAQPGLVHHAFEVHMLSMNDMPEPVPTAGNAGPVARYLKYTFPCDSQALYTQDMPVQACTAFEEATFAQHKIALPSSSTILQHLCQQSPDDGNEPSLCFEVYDCFDDGADEDEDRVCLIGKLPLSCLLQSINAVDVERVRTDIKAPCVEQGVSNLPVFNETYMQGGDSLRGQRGKQFQRMFIVQLTSPRSSPQDVSAEQKPYISVRVAYEAEC